MNDFERQAEEAKRARMQGIKFSRPGVPSTPKRNRIEEALGGKISSYEESSTYMPTIPKRILEEKPVEKLPENISKKSNYTNFLKRFFLWLAIIFLIGLIGVFGYSIFKTWGQDSSTNADATVEEVGKLVDLPEGETPTIATVSDLEPLKDQAFFKDAEIGDKVLIFGTSKKAILYRPSANKVIAVAPLK
jgi:hypothetical protein